MKRAWLSACVVACAASVTSVASAQDMGPPAPGMPAANPPQQNQTQRDLQNSQQEDSGLGLEWVYLTADGGFGYVNMASFNDSKLALQTTSASGGMFGFAAGIRLLFLTLGLRARDYTAFNLWQINADVGFHMRLGNLDPYLAIRGGYDTQGATLGESVTGLSNAANGISSSVAVHGWNAGLAFGMDYYFAHVISLGGEVSGDLLFLSRPPAPLPSEFSSLSGQDQATVKANPLYANSGSSVGVAASAGLHLGIHF